MESFLTWINLGILSVSAGSAWWAATSAKKSSRVEQSTQQTAKQQAQYSFAEMVRGWRPDVTMELSKVSYRWATNATMWQNEGSATKPELEVDESITLSNADTQNIRVEIVAQGRIINRTTEQMLLTVKALREDVYYPLQNECRFILEGKPRTNYVLGPESVAEFTWVDRKTLDDWRELYQATNRRSDTVDKEFSRELRPASLWQRLRGQSEESAIGWNARIRSQAGFIVVAENRMVDRVSTVWRVEPGQSAIKPSSNAEPSEDITWKLQSSAEDPIDDDVLLYRCYYDTALAQLNTPRVIKLPGRI